MSVQIYLTSNGKEGDDEWISLWFGEKPPTRVLEMKYLPTAIEGKMHYFNEVWAGSEDDDADYTGHHEDIEGKTAEPLFGRENLPSSRGEITTIDYTAIAIVTNRITYEATPEMQAEFLREALKELQEKVGDTLPKGFA